MSIPPMVNGILPPGTYPATLGEVTAAFNQPDSRTRPALNAALGRAALLIWSRDASSLLYVKRSYVTDTRDPLDVDLAVRSDVWDDSLFAAAFSAAHPGDVSLVDVFFNPQHSAQHMEEFFREIQGSGDKKGIVRPIR